MCSCGPLLAHFVFFFHSPDLIRDNTTHLTIQILCCVTSLYDLFMTTQEGCPLVFIGSSQHMSHQHFSVLFNAFQSFTPAEKTSSFICINHIQMLEYHTRKKNKTVPICHGTLRMKRHVNEVIAMTTDDEHYECLEKQWHRCGTNLGLRFHLTRCGI